MQYAFRVRAVPIFLIIYKLLINIIMKYDKRITQKILDDTFQ